MIIYNCNEFDLTTDENKLSYTIIYNQYITLIETHINNILQQHGYSLTQLISLCHENELLIENSSHDVFDILHSLTDYNTFKQMICEYKLQHMIHNDNNNNNRSIQQQNIDFGLTVTKLK